MTLPSPAASVFVRRAQPEDVQHVDEIFRIVNTAYRSSKACHLLFLKRNLSHPQKRATLRRATDAGWTHETHLLKDNRISKEGILQILNDKGRVLLLAFESESGRVLGTAQLDPAECNPDLDEYKGEGEGEIGSTYTEPLPKNLLIHLGLLSIDPEYQSRGLGRKLVEAALHYAKETLGRKQAVVTVLYQRPELSSWYKRLGFVDYGEKKSYPDPSSTLQDNIHFVVLRRTL